MSRGKSQAIQHNSALPKVGQSLRRLRLVCLPLRALRVRVMVCYVLRPSPANGYFGSRCSFCSFRRYAQGGVDPARPAGLPAAARTALLVPASAAQLPVRPRWGSPKARPSHRITSTNSLSITPHHESEIGIGNRGRTTFSISVRRKPWSVPYSPIVVCPLFPPYRSERYPPCTAQPSMRT